LIALREELPSTGQAAPHFEKGAALEAFCLELSSIAEQTLLNVGVLHLEKSYRLSLVDVDPPRALLGADDPLRDRACAGREGSQQLRWPRRLRPGEQRREQFEHGLHSVIALAPCIIDTTESS